MIEDVYDPLSRYRDEFKGRFTALAKGKFFSLVEQSGVDIDANRRQVAAVHALEDSISSKRKKRAFSGILTTISYIATVIGVGYVFVNRQTASGGVIALTTLGGAAAFTLAIWTTRIFIRTGRIIKGLEAEVRAAMNTAWRQMAPLNALYTWDLTTELIQKTVPRLEFDPYFSSRRLDDLKRLYGWNDDFNDGRSILFAQSGVINGNPFLIGEYLDMDWGEETYTGYLTIQWQEEVKDEKGNIRLVTRTETLTASVTKPAPCYSTEKALIYGNDAAPTLSFSRQPSSLSGADDGIITSIRKKWRLSRLKSLARDLENSDFTLMANHEFETLFHCRDRDNEVEFRLLYTALAQKQTLDLLKDGSVGYGDDFAFIKQNRINVIFARHLNEGTIDTAPENFRHWDIDSAWKQFMSFNERYFKDVYFALAPILAIPLYQQTRTHQDIWKGVTDSDTSSFWEHEATANYLGEDNFRHPECITRSILKTCETRRHDGTSKVEVTAYGFKGEARCDYIPVYGGDGYYHDVPVEWIEYLPVENTTEIIVSEQETPSPEFTRRYNSASTAAYRKSMFAFIPS